MKVSELIELLQQQDQDAMVVVQGYKGGLHDVADPEAVTLKLNVNSPRVWYYGPHEEDESGEAKAVLLGRG